MKKYLLIIISLLLFVGGSVSAEVKTYNRKDYDNYGVKKGIIINDNNINNVYETAFVDASEKIYDFAEILTKEEELKLKEFANEFIDKNKMDVVILTIKREYENDYENENIAADFYDYNDFGIDFKNYSGILLLRNANPSYPYYDMYTFGDAQLYYDYSRMNSILDYIGNDIGERNYYDAFHDFISELDYYYDYGISQVYEDYYVDSNGDLHKRFNPPIIPALLVSTFVTMIIIITLVKRNKLVSKPTRADEYLDVNSINYKEKTDNFKNAVTTSYVVSSSSGSSGGHSSGGFHSGGGSHSHGSSGRSHSSGGGRHR